MGCICRDNPFYAYNVATLLPSTTQFFWGWVKSHVVSLAFAQEVCQEQSLRTVKTILPDSHGIAAVKTNLTGTDRGLEDTLR